MSEQKRWEATSSPGDPAIAASSHPIVGFASPAVWFAKRKVIQREEAIGARDNIVAGKSSSKSAESRDIGKAASRDAKTVGAAPSDTAYWKVRATGFAQRFSSEFEQR